VTRSQSLMGRKVLDRLADRADGLRAGGHGRVCDGGAALVGPDVAAHLLEQGVDRELVAVELNRCEKEKR
jgi:hypothetical protein